MTCRKCSAALPEGAVFCHMCGVKQEVSNKNAKRRGNGQGTAYKRGSGNWQCEITTPVRRTKGGFKTKKEALAYIPQLALEKREKTTLSGIYEVWEETALPKLSSSKQTAYKIAYKKIPKAILNMPIEEVTISNLQSIISGMTYYPARDIKVLLSHLYKRACAQGDVPNNLSEYIELPKLEEKEQEAFTEKEITTLWENYTKGDLFTGYILLMIYSGMMPGELLDCRRDMIDFEKQTIVGAGRKTKKRKETPIALADCILPVVEKICGETKLIHINKDKFYTEYYAALERAGVRKLTPYSCRHTTATALATKVAPSILQEVMRHSKYTTTQRYIHPTAEQTVQAVNTITNNLPTNSTKT